MERWPYWLRCSSWRARASRPRAAVPVRTACSRCCIRVAARSAASTRPEALSRRRCFAATSRAGSTRVRLGRRAALQPRLRHRLGRPGSCSRRKARHRWSVPEIRRSAPGDAPPPRLTLARGWHQLPRNRGTDPHLPERTRARVPAQPDPLARLLVRPQQRADGLCPKVHRSPSHDPLAGRSVGSPPWSSRPRR